ncbi:complement component C8 alpha chain isoform X2 [Lampris incognitus]|uniref:complement component C8 alpha chain isoform X2 n=1 Tax=Lampris incognitus TaxID=2546036 RepID=UPI0024B5624B|nr:complement component C8 alpha chain isoform X2 [Lampris incognitus]
MDAYVCTLLGFYSVFNSFPIVDASKGPWTTAENGWAAANVIRRARAVNKPIPINCKLGAWSSWSPCNSCTDKKHRFRYLERPSQFGGSDCVDKLWNTFTCPRATTECLEPDYCEESFTCKGTGRCISQSLRCNGEPDCEDDSDEEGCERVTSRDDKCSTLQPIPGAKRGVQGYNVLTNEFMDPVLDQKYYGGQCEYVYNGEWKKFGYESFCENLHLNEEDKNFRKPYNYHYYRFMAQAASEGSNEYYEDLVDLVKARKKESSSNGGFTVGISYVEVGLKGSSEAKFLTNMTQHNAQDLGFIRLQSQVQTANFKIRSDKLMLHDDLYVSLMELPEQYNFGTYSQFFDTFGTHYVTEGTMGGTLEYIAAVNKTSMLKLGVKGQQVGSCIGATLGISKTISKSVSADLTLRANGCGKTGEYDTVKGAHLDIIEDSVTIVKGGITESSSTLLAIRDPDTYRKWGETLKYNPTLIEFEAQWDTHAIWYLMSLHLQDRVSWTSVRGDKWQRRQDRWVMVLLGVLVILSGGKEDSDKGL